ncbi:MAG: hypothetical protein N2439_11330 [Anaerolineae bacterium]|nr:hypothetical protein [Anaerolineae bacterium]
MVLLIAAGLCVAAGLKQRGCTLPWLPRGPADIYVIYEEARVTPTFADLIVDARRPGALPQLAQRGHRLYFIDNDAVDASGVTLSLIQRYGPFSDDKVEVIAVSRQPGKEQLLGRRATDYDLTAEGLAAIIQGWGL